MAVGLLAALVPGPGLALELAVLIAANAVATVARFIVLRTFIVGSLPDITRGNLGGSGS